MSPDLMWNNLINYFLQIGLLIGVAGFVPAMLRLSVPRARLAFWHVLLAACLLLPLFAPKRRQMVTVPARVTTRAVVAPRPVPAVPDHSIPWTRIGLLLFGGGAAIRLIWLCAGLWRLRQYRERSEPVAQESSWSVEADLRISEDVASPVTFGVLDPVVLLPPAFSSMDQATQDAILCHEILHVRRKDWLVMLAEEMVRCALWFHPAIWWLLGEIGLAREQAVDRDVVEMTKSREEYVDALLAIAGAKPGLDLTLAPTFLRKRHLKQRVVSILKEVQMSKKRSISALAAGLGILAASCWFVTMTFPLAAAPQTVMDGAGVTVDTGGAAMMHRGSIIYPEQARRAKVEGTVVVETMLDSVGNVIDARIVSGPNELRRSVLQSVLQWHFANDSGGNTRQVKVTFQSPATPEGQAGLISRDGVTGGATVTRLTVVDTANRKGAAPGVAVGGVFGGIPAPGLSGKKLLAIRVNGLSDEARDRLLSHLPVHAGDILADDSFDQVARNVREYDEHLNVAIARRQDADVEFIIMAPGSGNATPRPEFAPPANGARRITIGASVQSAKLVAQPRPVYPALAKQARIQGTVNLAAVIATDGGIRDIQVISGHPLLIPAALEAVRQWRYAPTLLNGDPVEVSTQIDVNFTLADEPAQQ